MILTEATKFLFSELGKGLDVWKRKKGEQVPQTVEPQPDAGAPILRMDDLEQTVNMELLSQVQGRIEASHETPRKLTKELDSHRKQLPTDTLLDPKTRA